MENKSGGRGGGYPGAVSARAVLPLVFLIALLTTTAVAAAEPYAMQYQLLTIYEDGAVRVHSEFYVDPLYPSVYIALIGGNYRDVVVTDSKGMPLGYSTSPGGISVRTLGATGVKVAYTTHEITSKSGKYWSIDFNSSIPAWVAFPYGASVISLNAVPEAIDTSGGRILMLMPAGRVAVTYVLSVVGTPDHAFLAISDAGSAISEISAAGINVSSAEAVLSDAILEFDSGNYSGAEELAGYAKTLALQTNATAHQASAMIAFARDAILRAQSEGRTVGLGDAVHLLDQATSLYVAGEYQSALSSASEASARAAAAVTAVQAYALYAAVALVGLAAVAAILLLRMRGSKKALKGYVKEIHEVDLERIAREGQLREEDLKLIEILAENGGEAFESSVREKFDLPKTTLWRMVKRLEKEGFISVEKFAGQNLLKVRHEYLKK
ncbi:MAG: hypothetical protein ABC606_00680 [Candidatus Methanosuratincola petrocarbonis]